MNNYLKTSCLLLSLLCFFPVLMFASEKETKTDSSLGIPSSFPYTLDFARTGFLKREKGIAYTNLLLAETDLYKKATADMDEVLERHQQKRGYAKQLKKALCAYQRVPITKEDKLHDLDTLYKLHSNKLPSSSTGSILSLFDAFHDIYNKLLIVNMNSEGDENLRQAAVENLEESKKNRRAIRKMKNRLSTEQALTLLHVMREMTQARLELLKMREQEMNVFLALLNFSTKSISAEKPASSLRKKRKTCYEKDVLWR